MEITKEQFSKYEEIRQSGVTNMFNVTLVCQLSGLNKEECMAIMKQYGTLMEKYPEVRETKLKKKFRITENVEEYEECSECGYEECECKGDD